MNLLLWVFKQVPFDNIKSYICLLYTSDAADE